MKMNNIQGEEQEERKRWLALFHVPGIGPAKFHAYLKKDPSLDFIEQRYHISWEKVDRDLKWMQQPDRNIILMSDKNYPELLKSITNPPPLLYVHGKVEMLNKPQIAMVGSRYPSHAGERNAYKFAQYFAQLGFVVTSGLALGIDTASHRGALAAAGGETIAVLGHGMDRIYPSCHSKISQEIVQRGALISEFCIGSEVLPANFPRRNRIISGLSIGLIVVEAAIKSGSLITAKMAMEQGREVFAIPGSIHNAKVKGCHKLIQEGAKLAESANDVLEELGALLKYVIRGTTPPLEEESVVMVCEDSRMSALLQQIDYEATPIDVVVARSGLPMGYVSGMLSRLELDGYIASVPGGVARNL